MSKIEKALNRARSRDATKAASPVRALSVQSPSQGRLEDQTALCLSDQDSRGTSSAAIARMNEGRRLERSELDQRRIIYPDLSANEIVQAFREIRTKILQRSAGRNCTVMVTSVTGESGNSFVALNLSVAFALDAAKTALLVDCNLRHSLVQTLLPHTPAAPPPGLTDYLESSRMDVSQIIHTVGIERLRVIPAGGRRENPSEYFTSSRMRLLMESLRSRYPERFIIIDAPPMTQRADAQILAELCDFIVLVVPYGKVTDSQIQACVAAIDGRKLIGAVFNDEPCTQTMSRLIAGEHARVKERFGGPARVGRHGVTKKT